ncbi:MAG: phosphoglucomutase/phosphomannomutase family protein [Dehalococcoidia bacterium]|nr:phosphoglucomutase/phosphomannomutase family protein [Dehalococcoidia bacterium]
MPETSIKFGTDGWRGIIAEDFTFDNVRICAQGVADYLKQSGLSEQGLVIGYDTRFASEDFAAAAAEVIAGNNIRVHLCLKPAPTPVVSFAVPATKAAGAIIITASHNPGSWNGFKYKSQMGASVPDEVTSELEKNIARIVRDQQIKRLALDKALKKGLIDHIDPSIPYFKQMGQLVDLEELRLQKLKIIVDPMYGAGSGYFKELLKGGNIEVTEINAERNPSFPGIQPEPIAKNLARLSRLVVERKAHIGLASDGDADRIGIVDEKGQFLNQHQVFALLCLYLLDVRGERGAMIKTLTSTDMISRLGKAFGVPVYETPVGFKYVAPLMMRENAIVGGEESGGYGFRGHIPERDSILAGLYFLDFMAKTHKTPSQLLDYLYSKVGPHYYERIDSHITGGKRQSIIDRLSSGPIDTIADTRVTRMDTTDGFRFFLADESWLLIRFSGTEPLVRLYAESESTEKVKTLLNEGKRLIGV